MLTSSSQYIYIPIAPRSDHAVVIWEEREGGFNSLATPERSAEGFFEPADNGVGSAPAPPSGSGAGGGAACTESGTSSSRWIAKATLSDARRAVTSVEFAPRHLGLRIASGSADGLVRIYEALDTMNLNHWKLEAEIEENTDGGAAGVIDDNNVGSDNGRWREGGGGGMSMSNEGMGVSSLSWCTGRFEPATLVVGYSSGRVSICRYDDSCRMWLEAMRLPGHATSGGVPRGVLDVAWAPNVGRSFHLIASCGKDDRLLLHRIKRGRGGDGSNNAEGSGLTYEKTELLNQSCTNWRCQWNVTGTVLASSGDGGTVKLWKNDFKGRWKCVSEVVGDASAGNAAVTAAASLGR